MCSCHKIKHRDCPDDHAVIKEVYEDNCYKLPMNINGWRIVDLGANIGSFSLLASERGAMVECYEPEINNFKLLTINLKDYNCKFNQKAVFTGDKCGVTNTAGRSKIVEGNYIDSVTLDQVIDNKEVDFMKVDIEGSEYIIFKNCNQLDKIKRMVIEVHGEVGDLLNQLKDNFIIKIKQTEAGKLMFCKRK